MSQIALAHTASMNGAGRAKRDKTLPNPRVGFSKQIEILRAYSAACNGIPRPVSNTEISKLASLKPETVALTNNFFVNSGLLEKADGGFIPCAEVLGLVRA